MKKETVQSTGNIIRHFLSELLLLFITNMFLSFIFALPVMILWNAVITNIFIGYLTDINFMQSVLLLSLTGLINIASKANGRM